MATQALDLVTMTYALDELSDKRLGDCQWAARNSLQDYFLWWHNCHRKEIRELNGLEALASLSHGKLNAFLSERGFEPQFQPFDGVGVASVLDMLVNWLKEGKTASFFRYEPTHGDGGGYASYPAFHIPGEASAVYGADGFCQPLARLLTRSGHSLWLMKSSCPSSEMAIAETALKMLRAGHDPMPHLTAGVIVPMLEIEVRPDLSWMLGLSTESPRDGYHEIAQAFQQFKLRANAEGARVKVATGFATTRGASSKPTPYVLNEPFIGVFTAPGHDQLPIAAFWADTDSWKNPGGELEEL